MYWIEDPKLSAVKRRMGYIPKSEEMTNEIFIARKISELPKDEGFYFVYWKDGCKSSAYFYKDGTWSFNKSKNPVSVWLEPITIEQLIAEHPELVEKIFEAARKKTCQTPDGNSMNMPIYPVYPTATDYINSLKG